MSRMTTISAQTQKTAPPDRRWDELSTRRFYEEHAERYADLTLSMSLSTSLTRFLATCPPGLILDLGCGAGRDLRDMTAAGRSAVGLDLSVRLAAKARQVSGAPVAVADLRHIPMSSGLVAGIWASASLLHTAREDLSAALDEAARVLKPGGAMFTSVKSGRGDYRTQDGRWFALHEERDWIERLEGAGLQVLSTNVGPGRSTTGPKGDIWITCFARRT